MSAPGRKKAGSISGASEHSGLSFHSSATGISSVSTGSSSSSGSVLTVNGGLAVELKSRLFILFAYVTKAGLPPWAAVAFCCIDLLQLFSFAFSAPLDGLWAGADDTALRHLELLRTFGAAGRLRYSTYAAIFWIFVAYLSVTLLLAVVTGLRLARGEETWTRISSFTRWTLASFAPVFYTPSLTYFVGSFSCRDGVLARFAAEAVPCESGLPLLIVGALFAVLTIATGFAGTTLFYQMFPDHRQWLSMTSSRGHMLSFATKTALVLISELFLLGPGQFHAVVYGAVGSAAMLAVLVFFVHFLPYHKAVVNYAVCAWLGICTATFVLRFLSSFATATVAGAYVFGGMLVPVGLIVAGATYLRARHLGKRNLKPLHDGGTLQFEKEFEVEIATRFAYRSTDPEMIDEAMTIYIRACERFNQSAAVRIAQCTFMVCHVTDYQLLTNYISRAKRTAMMPDQLYSLHRVDYRRKELVRAIDGGEEEITDKLARATRYQEECKRWIRAFWQHLLREDDLNKIPEIVSSIETYERKAEEVFRGLLIAYPRSPRVVRAFGVFLAEVKADMELSQLALRSADDLEEERAKHAHKRKTARESKKRRGVGKSGSATFAKGAVDGDKPGHGKHKAKQAHRAASPSPIEPDREPASKSNLRFEEAPQSDSDHDADDVVEMEAAAGMEWAEEEEPFTEDAKAGILEADAEMRSRREELQRKGRYRKRLEQSKSSALLRLGWAVKITMLVMIVDVIVIYASTKSIIGQFSASVDVLDKAGMVRAWASQQAINARAMHKAVVITNSTDEFLMSREQLKISTAHYRDDLRIMRFGVSSAEVDELWNMPNLEQVYWRQDSGEKELGVTNMFDMSIQLLTSSWAVAQMNFTDMAGIQTNTFYRYIMDNFNTVTLAYRGALSTYTDQAVAAAATMTTTLYVLLPVSVVALIVLAVGVFRPTLKRIREERDTNVRLFTALPKLAVSELLDRLQAGKKDDVVAANEMEDFLEDANLLDVDLSSEGDMPVLRSLALRYFGSLGVIFAVIAAMFGLGLAFPSLAVPGTFEVMAAYNRFAHAMRSQLFTNELVYQTPPESIQMGDNLTWSNASQVKFWIADSSVNFRLNTFGLKYGNDSMNLRGHPEDHPDVYHLMFNYECHLPDLQPDCYGLDALVAVYLRDLGDVLASRDPIGFDTPHVRRMEYMMGQEMYLLVEGAEFKHNGELTIMLRRMATMYKRDTHSAIAAVDVPLMALFIVSFPILVVSFLILRPLETRIRQENIRMMKMLLMVPGEVIDKVPALVEFLDTGKQENAQQKLKDALDEYVARNESILSASVDGIVVVNAAKQVEMFSPAAEAIFGFSEDEVKGKNLNLLMPPEVAIHHDGWMDKAVRNGALGEKTFNKVRELVAQRKDGSKFPILLSLNLIKINEKVLVSAFIRDISLQKEKDAQLTKEKEKSEKLLLSLLPAVVAEQLKEEGVEASGQLLHAEGYKEVSVLFADLVGFTKMSAGISPSELVFTLNKLFSMFDMLCDKYSLEKIKTIGDCYMVAGGCPERSVDHPQRMLEFGIEMLEKLHEFNREHGRQLKLRIGMNVGPVVAGVLGLKKITYDLWGDAVNVASRMESSGVENRIQVSHAAFEILNHDYMFEERGKMEIKGKGLMLTYLYKDRKLSKTASGTVFRRAALTPPPGASAAASRRPSNAGVVHEGSSGSSAAVDADVPKPIQPRASESEELDDLIDTEIRQRPTVDGPI